VETIQSESSQEKSIGREVRGEVIKGRCVTYEQLRMQEKKGPDKAPAGGEEIRLASFPIVGKPGKIEGKGLKIFTQGELEGGMSAGGK